LGIKSAREFFFRPIIVRELERAMPESESGHVRLDPHLKKLSGDVALTIGIEPETEAILCIWCTRKIDVAELSFLHHFQRGSRKLFSQPRGRSLD
jgi:hypothetical protein